MTTPGSPKEHTNRLALESSPYLLQHAGNPVDWYPWGEEAFARARAENKPIFLSIGYAACHWCHVMERESFENEKTAGVLNRNFVSIKVDREERPDLDDLYMQAVQILSGSGGWPMSVFLTPEGKPFFGGTYFPPEDLYGRIGFRKLLQQIVRIWEDQPDKVAESSQALTQAIAEAGAQAGGAPALGPELLGAASADLRARFDPQYGGFDGAPKFPPSMALDFLLREHHRTGDARLLEMVEQTLKHMARGGVYDQLGGGFHRYSVDPYWLVPHFEKMLYDNALLAPVYFSAALVTGDAFYEAVGREILDTVLREMTDPQGGFTSTQDADSEGEEGKYYVWRPEEVSEALGPEDAALACEFYDIGAAGNWHEGRGSSILTTRLGVADFARVKGLDEAALRGRLGEVRAKLLQRRSGRTAPFKDDKVIAAWNGLMISALARGAQATGEARYREAARRGADFVLGQMRDEQGGLLRIWRGGVAKVGAFLEDYANLIVALLDLYETTFDIEKIQQADALAQRMLDLFYDPQAGGFFTADGRDPTLVARIKEFHDGATPSGNAAAVHALQRLGALLGRAPYREAAGRTLDLFGAPMMEIPRAHYHMLCAASFALAGPREVAIIGDPEAEPTRALLEALWREYEPHRLVALAPEGGSAGAYAQVALLKDKTALGGRPTAYVCRDYACRQPVHTPEELRAQLRR